VAIFCAISWIKKFWDLRERLFYAFLLINILIFSWATNNTPIIS